MPIPLEGILLCVCPFCLSFLKGMAAARVLWPELRFIVAKERIWSPSCCLAFCSFNWPEKRGVTQTITNQKNS